MSVETRTIPIDLNRNYTAEELPWVEDDGNNYELIEGKLIMTPPPEGRHGTVSDNLVTELKNFLRANPGVGRIWSNVGFNLGKKPNGKDNVLAPDIGFIVASRVPPSDKGYLPYPDLAVEVWSSESDLGDGNKLKKARDKLRMYLKAGTSIAWGINPEKQEVEVYYRDPSKPMKKLSINHELDGEDVIKGFKLPLRALFEAL